MRVNDDKELFLSCSALLSYHTEPFSGHTFGTPTLGCREDTPDGSSTNERCSGNGKHATMEEKLSLADV